MRSNSLVGGFVLILLGGLLFANAMGFRLPFGQSLTELFWPIILIFLGVWVLVSIFSRGKFEAESASIDLQGASEASLTLKHGAGELRLHGGATENQFAHGTFEGGLDHKASRNGSRLDVRMRPARDFISFPFIGVSNQFYWDVALNQNIPTSVWLSLGANKSVIDLPDMNVTELKLQTGASDTDLTLPARGRFRADFELGAASLAVTIPESLSARIRASLSAADMNIDKTRFPYLGNAYQSPDYDAAVNAVDVNISAGAASISIK